MTIEVFLGSAIIGFLFGLALAIPPGPMNAIIAEESVNRGWRAGTTTGAGAMLADVCFFLLAFLGMATFVDQLEVLEGVLFLIGGVLMLVFAVDAGRAALSATRYAMVEVDTKATGFQKALLLGLTNPFQLAFWLSVGIGLVRPGTIDVGEHIPVLDSIVIETGSIWLLGGFFVAIIVWIVTYPFALVTLGDRFDAAAPVISAISAFILTIFGLTFGWLGLRSFG